MSDKTLGQVAFEAWSPEWVHTVVQWDSIPQDHRERWQAAADAVVRESDARLDKEACGYLDELTDSHAPVIEAARAWYTAAEEEMRWVMAQPKIGVNPQLLALFQALEAAEKGDD